MKGKKNNKTKRFMLQALEREGWEEEKMEKNWIKIYFDGIFAIAI